MQYIKFLYLLMVINLANSMEYTIQKQTDLPDLPQEIWSHIFSYVPISHQLKQLLLAKNKIVLSKNDIQFFANEWYDITQKKLAKIADDGLSEVNLNQKNYLKNALAVNERLNQSSQKYFHHTIERLIQRQLLKGEFKKVENHLISAQYYNPTSGYRIKRLSTAIPLTPEQIKLFLVSFGSMNAATINAIDPEFPIEQVHGMGKWGEGFSGSHYCNAYFERSEFQNKYNYQKYGTFDTIATPAKKPISVLVDSIIPRKTNDLSQVTYVIKLPIQSLPE